MRDRRKDLSLPIRDEINVTPLMDLTFLLLIVFMITAPMMEFGLDVSPPALDGEILEQPRNVTVNIDREGRVYLDDGRVPRDLLVQRLRSMATAGPLSVRIRGDERRQYGEIMGVMRAVRKAGIGKVSLVTRSEGRDGS